MLGYVVCDKGELKVREYEIYQGYYCGVCKYIGREYGQLPRMVLSYDAAFLALLLACVNDEKDHITSEHCIVHHIKYQSVAHDPAIEYAGDLMLILAWFKLMDDAADEGKVYAKATRALFRRKYEKLKKKHPRLCSGIESNLKDLSKLEMEKCSSLDRAAEAFARIMQVIFSQGILTLYEEKDPALASLHKTFADIGYHMGKWVYLIDAVDDIEKDLKSGAYNPLLYRFAYDEEKEDPQKFRERIDEALRFNLYHYLAVIGESLGTLDIVKNSGIIENVIYFGLNRKTDDILKRKSESKEK